VCRVLCAACVVMCALRWVVLGCVGLCVVVCVCFIPMVTMLEMVSGRIGSSVGQISPSLTTLKILTLSSLSESENTYKPDSVKIKLNKFTGDALLSEPEYIYI